MQEKISKEEVLKDLKGKKFGRLTVLKEVEYEKKGTHYLCKCDCGNEVIVRGYNLLNGMSKSCGCLRSEKAKKNIEGIRETTLEGIKKNQFKGTMISSLTGKVRKDSKTGYKGVSIAKNGKYIAYIKIRKKRIHLGTFDTIEGAVQAREEGERIYFEPILKQYKELNK